jgi:5-methyltetrahydropteroyltriglutamate--homocysteine methyltransferase
MTTIPTESIGSVPSSPKLIEAMAGSIRGPLDDQAIPNRARVLKIIHRHIKPAQRAFIDVVSPTDPRAETPEEVRDRTLQTAKHLPIEPPGTTDDRGFSPVRDAAFAKIRARVLGKALASAILGVN